MSEQNSVIVVGAGLSGLATALGVAVRGAAVTVFEAGELLGGAAAYSGGQVWCGGNHVAVRQGIEGDTLDLAERYVREIAHSHPEVLDEQAMRRWLEVSPDAVRYWEDVGAIRWTVIPGLADYHNEADGALPEGRYLTNEPIDAAELGEWRDKLRVSPYFPVGTTYAEMFVKGRRLTNVDEESERRAGRRPGLRPAHPAGRRGRGARPADVRHRCRRELPGPRAAGAVDRAAPRAPRDRAAHRRRRCGGRGARGEPGRPGGGPRAGRARDQHLRLGRRAGAGAGRPRPGRLRQRRAAHHPGRRHPAGPRPSAARSRSCPPRRSRCCRGGRPTPASATPTAPTTRCRTA